MVTKVKAYHSAEAIHNSLEYIENKDKTNLNLQQGAVNKFLEGQDTEIINAFNYATNPEKTKMVNESGEETYLVAGHNCKPDTAEMVFRSCQEHYYATGHKDKITYAKVKRPMRALLNEDGTPFLDADGKMVYNKQYPVYKDPDTGKVVYEEFMQEKLPRTAYMHVLAFPPPEVIGYQIDGRVIMAITKEWCKECLPDHPAIISVHMDKHHGHSHIVSSAYSLPGMGEAHKYKDCKETLMHEREVADQLSLKVGIPIIVGRTEKSVNWYDWKQSRDGANWKDTMRQDIRGAAKLSKSYAEFKSILEESGYRLRETDKTITYYMPCANENDPEYRCRGDKLNIAGDQFDYSKGGMMKMFGEITPEQTKEQKVVDPQKRAEEMERFLQQKRREYQVHRYTFDGRRRGALEMLILKAIALLKLFRDAFADPNPKNDSPVYQSAAQKLDEMNTSLALLQSLGLENKEDLERMINRVGMELSQLKKQYEQQTGVLGEEKQVLDKIDEAFRLMNSISVKDLCLYPYTKEEIQQAKAELAPATGEQRRELYLALEKNGLYRVDRKFDLLTFEEAQQAINYLQGKITSKPDVLLDISDGTKKVMEGKYERVLEARLHHLKEKNQGKPATEGQLKALEAIKTDPKLEGLDFTNISYYDAFRVINYVKARNEFNSPLLNEAQQQELSALLAEHNGIATRDFRYITVNEFQQIKAFYENKAPMPELLKERKDPSPKEISAVMELLALRDESITVPIDMLSSTELYRLNTYLLFRDDIPEILKATPQEERTELDNRFIESIVSLPMEEANRVSRCRELFNELGKIGITPENFITCKSELTEAIESCEKTGSELEEKRTEYRNLKRLEYSLNLAGNVKYTCGPLYQEAGPEAVEVDEKEPEENRIEERDIHDKNLYRARDKYFDQMNL